MPLLEDKTIIALESWRLLRRQAFVAGLRRDWRGIGRFTERSQFRGRGLGQLGGWRLGSRRLRDGFRLFGSKVLQGFEGAVVVAVGGIDGALQPNEGLLAESEAIGKGEDVIVGDVLVGGALPELGAADAVTAELPFAGDQGIDQAALFGGGGSETLMVFGGKLVERGAVFAGDALGTSIDTVLESIEAGSGLAGGGARPGRFLRIAAVGGDLTECGHGISFNRRHSMRAGEKNGGEERGVSGMWGLAAGEGWKRRLRRHLERLGDRLHGIRGTEADFIGPYPTIVPTC
jgi:hypothetical protein